MIDSRNLDTLHWFLGNDAAINSRDRYLLSFSVADIALMAPRTKSELVWLLTIARDLHSTESALRGKGQSALTDFFTSIPHSRA